MRILIPCHRRILRSTYVNLTAVLSALNDIDEARLEVNDSLLLISDHIVGITDKWRSPPFIVETVMLACNLDNQKYKDQKFMNPF
jgi:hypothetical protein